MEIETVKQKEKKISVKITKGYIWDELKEKLEENSVDKDIKDEDKKSSKKKLVVDVHVKREFRAVLKEEGWMCRIKSALGRSKVQDVSLEKEKKEIVEREKSRTKTNEKIKEIQLRRRQDSILKKKTQDESEPKSRSAIKDEEKDRNGLTKPKNLQITFNIQSKDHHKSRDLSSSKMIRNTSPSNEVDKSDKQAGKEKIKLNKNKMEETTTEIGDMVPNEESTNNEAPPLETVKREERARRNSISNEKRSRSKPGTVKEKLKKKSEIPSVMNLQGGSNLAISCLRSLKSSIISLKSVEFNKKEHMSKSKRRKKRVRRELEEIEKGGQGDGGNKREKLASSAGSEKGQMLQKIKLTCEETDHSNLNKSLNHETKEIYLNTSADESKKMKKYKDANDKSKMCCQIAETSGLKTDSIGSTNDDNAGSEGHHKKMKTVTRKTKGGDETDGTCCESVSSSKRMDLSDTACSSTSYSSSSGDNFICSCGCMDAAHKMCSTYGSNSSTSSCTSIEYLRSYSGNLVMCASGKKSVLADHIRYLSSCFEL